MQRRFYIHFGLSLLLVLSLCLLIPTSFLSATADDSGYLFLGAKEERRVKKFKDGNTLTAYHQFGTVASNEANSPWNRASFFAQGSVLTNSDNVLIAEVALCETIDNDGDITWMYHEWWYSNPPGSYEFIGGTGKWKGITGYGATRGMLRGRTDDHYMLKSEMHWNIKKD
ncbi:MAG: hypothetical protein O3C43_19645 [Verrucomicrobia bacterium]|nr:hypothetical protein [Verrucomicrobiota bacterium]MDA1068706.1 hypothetical protein [Verrucomicrobiota bacterium]